MRPRNMWSPAHYPLVLHRAIAVHQLVGQFGYAADEITTGLADKTIIVVVRQHGRTLFVFPVGEADRPEEEMMHLISDCFRKWSNLLEFARYEYAGKYLPLDDLRPLVEAVLERNGLLGETSPPLH